MSVTREKVRLALAEQLRGRAREIEEAIFASTREASGDAPDARDAQYIAGLRRAVAALVDFGIKTIEDGEQSRAPIPSLVIEQARLAARSGVPLATVSRRYAVGYNVLVVDFVMQEAGDFPSEIVGRVLLPLASRLDGVMDEATTAYDEELERLQRSPNRCRAERVEKLLNGEPVDTDDLHYDFTRNWHIAVIAMGATANAAVAFLRCALDRQELRIERDRGTVWAWLGGLQRIPARELERVMIERPVDGVTLAVGEPHKGLDGWRLSHQQAQAALSVAQRRPQPVTRYFDVALEALVLKDERAARQLIELRLGPLCQPDEYSLQLRRSLKAYFSADRVAKKAASIVGLHRRTIETHIDKAEALLEYNIKRAAGELELALRIFELLEDRE
jgi:hypothetical protein